MKYLFLLWKYSFLSIVAYRKSFLTQAGFMLLNDCFFVYVWYLFFQKFHTIGGLTFEQYVPLFSLFALIFALAHIFANGYETLASRIKNGTLDADLLLPKSPLLRIVAGEMSTAAIGDFIFAYVFLIVFCHSSITLYFFTIFTLAGILGALTYLGAVIFYHSIAFFIGSADAIAEGSRDCILGASFYPENVYSGTIMKFVYLTIFPTFFITYYPYDFVLTGGKLEYLAYSLFGTVFFLSLGIFTFYRGLKRYTSGNSMQVKV